jgi:hypothetical protein
LTADVKAVSHACDRSIGVKPAKKRVARVCTAIGQPTDRKLTHRDPLGVVTELNQLTGGRADWFCMGTVTRHRRLAFSGAQSVRFFDQLEPVARMEFCYHAPVTD